MSHLQISALSTEFIRVPVAATVGGSAYNPTSDTVQIALTAVGSSPASGDWHAATWETISGVYYAKLLVGPGAGGVTVSRGQYGVWLKVTDNPEVPVLLAGQIEVT